MRVQGRGDRKQPLGTLSSPKQPAAQGGGTGTEWWEKEAIWYLSQWQLGQLFGQSKKTSTIQGFLNRVENSFGDICHRGEKKGGGRSDEQKRDWGLAKRKLPRNSTVRHQPPIIVEVQGVRGKTPDRKRVGSSTPYGGPMRGERGSVKYFRDRSQGTGKRYSGATDA